MKKKTPKFDSGTPENWTAEQCRGALVSVSYLCCDMVGHRVTITPEAPWATACNGARQGAKKEKVK